MNPYVKSAAVAVSALVIMGLQVMPSAAFAAERTAAVMNTLPPLQITHKKDIKVVIQVNYPMVTPKGISAQVQAAENLYHQYAALGMKSGKDFEIAMVFRAAGSQFLLNDEAYNHKVKQAHGKGNPSRAILDALAKDGVKMYECGVAMKVKKYTAHDLLPYARIVVSGMGALVDLEKSGYLPVTP